MTDSGSRTISNILFGVRLLLFVAVTLIYPHYSQGALFLVVLVVLGITFTADFMLGKTSWIATGKFTHVTEFAYLAGLVVAATQIENQPIGVGLVSPFLLLAFNSDAISNSRRWKILLPMVGVVWALRLILFRTGDADVPGFAGTPWVVWLYSLIPAMATLSRLFFTRTKNLIHTSLDYRTFRVELLSFGMKRLEAVGIKRREKDSVFGK